MEQSQEIEYEKLLQFVYACPVGLVDMARDGAINLMNPLAMKLVIPLATDGIMTNLLTVFENTAPELRSLIQDFAGRRGTICDNHRIYAGPIAADKPDEQRILNCTIVKLKDERYVVTLTDVSLQVRQERRLREAETWFGSLLEGVKDFGVASLGTDGVIDAVNSTLLEQTGFDAFELEGMPIGDLVEPQPGGQGPIWTVASNTHEGTAGISTKAGACDATASVTGARASSPYAPTKRLAATRRSRDTPSSCARWSGVTRICWNSSGCCEPTT